MLSLKGFIKNNEKIYYVSSNSSILNIEEYKSNPRGERGLSVLLHKENIDYVWIKWKKMKLKQNRLS